MVAVVVVVMVGSVGFVLAILVLGVDSSLMMYLYLSAGFLDNLGRQVDKEMWVDVQSVLRIACPLGFMLYISGRGFTQRVIDVWKLRWLMLYRREINWESDGYQCMVT